MDSNHVERRIDDHLRQRFFSHPDSPDTGPEATKPRELTDHLRSVAARSVWALDSRSGAPPDSVDYPEGPALRTTYVSGWLHDFGKLNPYFQRRLDVDGAAAADHSPRVSEMTYHARVGAFLTYYCLDAIGASELSQLAGYLAVAKHHGQLPDAADYITSTARADDAARRCLLGERESTRSDDDLLRDGWVWAIVSLLDERDTPPFQAARTVATQLIEALTRGSGSFTEFTDAVTSGALQQSLRQCASRAGMVQPDPAALPPRLYDRTLAVWSSLTLADKTDVQGLDDRLQAEHLSRNTVSRQIDALGGNETSTLEARLNALREQARSEVVNQGVPRLEASTASVGEITLPTGLGKTLTGIEAALTLRENRTANDSESRVIYALPYTSIIEQTRSILERDPEEKPPGFDLSPFSQAYSTHHYRAETVTTRTGEEPDGPAPQPAVAVAEAWRAGFTLTTFAQLFESLTGPANRQSMKLPALSNSIVILDEPQSIPYRWWDAAARSIRLLVEEFDATILLMTATQPRLVDNDPELDAVSLVASPDEYLTDAQRVSYTIDETVVEYIDGDTPALDYDTAAQRLLTRITEPDEGSALAVCNTVASARDLYRYVCECGSDAGQRVVDLGEVLDAIRGDPNSSEEPGDHSETDGLFEYAVRTVYRHDEAVVVGHLTSRHTPRDRRAILTVADELATAGVPFVFVTTQLIEAGVDVSFQSVYRDLAPLESIVQAAGRCNRSFEWGTTGGSVTVWRLAASPSQMEGQQRQRRTPSELIYDREQQRSLLRMVAETLMEHTETGHQFEEAALSEETLADYFTSVHERNYSARAITRYIEQAQAGQLAETSFIDDEQSVDVIVPRSPAERKTLRELRAVDEVSIADQIESFTESRVSVRGSDEQEGTFDAVERIDEDSEVRVLIDLDRYNPALGLRLP